MGTWEKKGPHNKSKKQNKKNRKKFNKLSWKKTNNKKNTKLRGNKYYSIDEKTYLSHSNNNTNNN